MFRTASIIEKSRFYPWYTGFYSIYTRNRQHRFGSSLVSNYLKKTTVPAEPLRPDVARARREGPEVMAKIPAGRLVFLDESSANTCRARLYGWGIIGQRIRSLVPCGRWRTTARVGAIRPKRRFRAGHDRWPDGRRVVLGLGGASSPSGVGSG